MDADKITRPTTAGNRRASQSAAAHPTGPQQRRRSSGAAQQILDNLRASIVQLNHNNNANSTTLHTQLQQHMQMAAAHEAHAATLQQTNANIMTNAANLRGFVDTSGMQPYHVIPAHGTTTSTSEKERLIRHRLSASVALRQQQENAAAHTMARAPSLPATTPSRTLFTADAGGWAAVLAAAAASTGVKSPLNEVATTVAESHLKKSRRKTGTTTTQRTSLSSQDPPETDAALGVFKQIAAKFGLEQQPILGTSTVPASRRQSNNSENNNNELLLAAAAMAFASQQQQQQLLDQQRLHKQQHPPHAVRKRIFLEPIAAAAAAASEIPAQHSAVDQLAAAVAGGVDVDGIAGAGQFQQKHYAYDVNDYVDYTSDRLIGAYVKRNILGPFVNSGGFRVFILLLILFNAIVIGVQTDETTARQYTAVFAAIDQIILNIFLLEILLKWAYSFDNFWGSGWNVFDFLIVCTLLMGQSLKFLSSARILRILRIVRAFRSLKSLSSFKGLSVVFATIIKSIPDLINVSLLLLILGTVLAVFGVTVLQKAYPERFDSFSNGLFTFFMCVTQDGWASSAQDFLARKDDPRYGIDSTTVVMCYIFFILSICLGAFVLYNLFVAVMMTKLDESMEEMEEEDREEQGEHGGEQQSEKQRMLDPTAPLTELTETVTIDPLIDAVSDFAENDRQTRAQMPYCLHKITAVWLQKFVFLQAALAQNLSEYKEHRTQIEIILRQVKALNPQWEAMERNAREEAEGAGERGSDMSGGGGGGGAGGTGDGGAHRTVRIGRFSRQSLSHTLEKYHVAQGDILSELMRLAPDTSSDINLDRILNDASRRTANKLQQSLRASLTVPNAVANDKNFNKTSFRR